MPGPASWRPVSESARAHPEGIHARADSWGTPSRQNWRNEIRVTSQSWDRLTRHAGPTEPDRGAQQWPEERQLRPEDAPSQDDTDHLHDSQSRVLQGSLLPI